jgi:thioesterase domain-containing protein
VPKAEIEAMLDVAFERYFETSGLFGSLSTCARMVERCRSAGVDEIACLLDFGAPTDRIFESLERLNQVRERAENPPAGAAPVTSPRGETPTIASTGAPQIYPFLAWLRERDVQVSADGDRLRCSAPPGVLTAELRDELQSRKSEILRFLNAAGSLARQQRAVVPLQSEAEGVPVFGVAGHNGDVFCYRALARHLREHHPFYGLQPPGLDGESEPFTRVEDLAGYFAGQIGEFHSRRPCIVAGYCSGGGIALELARQLVRDGAEVRFLALFGCPFPTWYRRLPQLRYRLAREMERVLRHSRTLVSLPSGERQSYLATRWRNLRVESALPTQTTESDPVLRFREKVGRATIAAVSRYTPGAFPGRVGLFLPTKAWLSGNDVVSRWQKVAPGVEGCYGPDGSTGDTMLREPYAEAFAKLFGRCYRRTVRVERPGAGASAKVPIAAAV